MKITAFSDTDMAQYPRRPSSSTVNMNSTTLGGIIHLAVSSIQVHKNRTTSQSSLQCVEENFHPCVHKNPNAIWQCLSMITLEFPSGYARYIMHRFFTISAFLKYCTDHG
jgi:hypothetical protein